MPKFKVQKNPFKSSDFEVVDADRHFERGSYTVFVQRGVDVLSIPTKLVTSIKLIEDREERNDD